MSQENVEIVRNWFDRWNSGDREVQEDEIDPDVEIATRMLGFLRGRDAIHAWFREVNDQFDTWTIVPERWHDSGDLVAVVSEVHLRGRKSGAAFVQPCGWLIELREGRLLRLQTFLDEPYAALEAAGLRE